jgi:hypothetical protein
LRDTVTGVLESQWDFGSGAMEARILRPLLWFGLLESRTQGRSSTEVVDRRLYREAPLFDRFVKFNVQVEGSDTRHYGNRVFSEKWRARQMRDELG